MDKPVIRAPNKIDKAKDFILLCVVTDPSGEWCRSDLIKEMKDMGFGHTTTASAIRTLKHEKFIDTHSTDKGRAERLFPTLKGVQRYVQDNGWPTL